jgi:ribonuclease HI
MERSDMVRVGVDGSCLSNPGPAGWAAVAEDGAYRIGWQPVGTNNIGELNAIREALIGWETEPLAIEIDSSYAMNAVTVWAKGWRARGWRKRDGKAPENLALIQDVVERLEARRRPVQFVKVRGHNLANDFPLNTAADALAVRASQRARDTGAAGDEQGSTDLAQYRPRRG